MTDLSEGLMAAIIAKIKDPATQQSVGAKLFPNRRLLHIDLETCSTLDLRKVGASAYSRHPDTKVTIFAWAFDTGPVQSIRLPTYLPPDVSQHLALGGRFVAWNAAFEWAFLTNFFGLKQMKPDQAVCAMQQALFAGLPGKLEHAGPALGLSLAQLKDQDGHRHMLTMSKPRHSGPFAGSYWHEDPVEGPPRLQRLDDYCKQDVIAERAVFAHTPPLTADELRVSLLDRVTNDRGILIDVPVVKRLIEIAQDETHVLNARCNILTKGVVTSPGTQTARLLTWLWDRGIQLPNVGKDIVAETLDTAVDAGLDPVGVKVLGIRQKVAKSSVKKLKAMLDTRDTDDRVRGTLQDYGAGRTGRFSGRLIQPQNFPRPPKGWNPSEAISAIMDDLDVDGVRLFYGEPLSVVSGCLRGCFIPSEGKQFMAFDLSQIEARVLAWLAGQNDVLDVFRKGEDVYTYTSDQLGLGSRQAGKVAVLGLGYGMGDTAFIDFAATNGLTLSKMDSLNIVTAWRDQNAFIRQFWRNLNAAAKTAISTPNRVITVGSVKLRCEINKASGQMVLQIQLPSGRPLWYRNPRLVPDPLVSGRTGIVFDGVDQYTKQWGPVRTWGSKLAENITQAAARDVIVEAALRVSCPGAELVLSVHDEILFEITPGYNPLYAKALIEQSPAWAKDLPVACEGGILDYRYGKG